MRRRLSSQSPELFGDDPMRSAPRTEDVRLEQALEVVALEELFLGKGGGSDARSKEADVFR